MPSEDAIKEASKLLETIRSTAAVATKKMLREEDVIELGTDAGTLASLMTTTLLDRAHQQPACMKGCAYCCHVMIECTVPEVVAIARHIRERFTEEEQGVVMQSIDAAVNATEGMSRDERFIFRTPCPLLKGNICSVYDVRPLLCRCWHSLDVGRCEQNHADPSHNRVPANYLAYNAGVEVMSGLKVALRHEGLEHRNIELIRGLKLVLQDPSLIDTWQSRPSAFEDALICRVHPDPTLDRRTVEADDALYRQTVNSPQWHSDG